MITAASRTGLRASEGLEQPITQGRAAEGGEIEWRRGPSTIPPEGSDRRLEREVEPSSLRILTAMWEDVQRTRLSAQQRGMRCIYAESVKETLPPHICGKAPCLPAVLERWEDRLGRRIRKKLEAHVIWPWLQQFPGLGGVHTARLVALIGDPHRFPGRQCEAGHHHSAVATPGESERAVGCGIELSDRTVCAALVGPVRRGTGTRSLWHYLGLHVVAGLSPRRQKGHKADWNPKGKTAVLMPGGIAEQIVRARSKGQPVPVYNALYLATKERLSRERADRRIESDSPDGPLPIQQAGAAEDVESVRGRGLRPFQIDAIARKVAAKAFVADLLQAWKKTAPLR